VWRCLRGALRSNSKIESINDTATAIFTAGRSVFLRCAGTAFRAASRTMRRCTKQLFPKWKQFKPRRQGAQLHGHPVIEQDGKKHQEPVTVDQFLIYQSEDGQTKLDVRLEGEAIWLSQKQLAELYGKSKKTVSEHIRNIFEDKELESAAVVRKFRTTAADGKVYNVDHYNLDMVLALGFRVRSQVAARPASG
jgi:hypothetical protein